MSSMAMTAVVILMMVLAGGSIWFVALVALLGFFLFAVRAVLQAWMLDATPPAINELALSKVLGTLLYDVRATDPVAGLAIGLLAIVAVAACYIPALRATRVSPVTALHVD